MKTKWFRRLTVTALVLGTAVALFYAEENWRGAHAWKKVEAELKDKGEALTIAEVIPPEVPDNQNMAMVPLWKEVFEVEAQNKVQFDASRKTRLSAIKLKGLEGKIARLTSISRGEKLDLKIWADYLGVSNNQDSTTDPVFALKAYLAKQDSLVAELNSSLRMPYKRWPLRYEDGIYMAIPQFPAVFDAAKFYQFRATVNLAAREEAEAYKDLESMWLLADSFKPETTLITGLVGMTVDNLALSVIWEGQASGNWSVSSLEKIQARLQRRGVLKGLLTSLRGERVAFLSFVEKMEAKDFLVIKSLTAGADEESWSNNTYFYSFIYFRPRGWIDQDKVLYSKAMQRGIEWNEKTIGQGYAISGISELNENFGLGSFSFLDRFQTPLTFLALPAISGAGGKFAEAEANQRMAFTTCALERYRIATGKVPESLETLVPTYLETLPVDIINGQPLKYVRKGEKDYLLYSVGLNGKDDGGYTSKDKSGGDWVWPSRPGLVEVRDK